MRGLGSEASGEMREIEDEIAKEGRLEKRIKHLEGDLMANRVMMGAGHTDAVMETFQNFERKDENEMKLKSHLRN